MAKYGTIFILFGASCFSCAVLLEGMGWRAASAYLGFSLVYLGVIYATGAPKLWLKRSDGSLSAASYLLLGPLHFMNWLSFTLALWINREPPFHEVLPNLLLGRRLFLKEARSLCGTTPYAVLDVSSELPETRPLVGQRYLCVPVLDHTPPTKCQLQRGLEFIAENIPERQVYVHCALGHGRSATFVAAWLMGSQGLSVQAAEQRLRALRPGVRLNHSQRELLEIEGDLCAKKSSMWSTSATR